MLDRLGITPKKDYADMCVEQLMSLWKDLYELGEVEWNGMYDHKPGLIEKLNKIDKEK